MVLTKLIVEEYVPYFQRAADDVVAQSSQPGIHRLHHVGSLARCKRWRRNRPPHDCGRLYNMLFLIILLYKYIYAVLAARSWLPP